MNYSRKIKLGGIFTCCLFLSLSGGLSNLPVVEGQYETPNNLCGGIFRSIIGGSIRFKYNETAGTHLRDERNKTCVWQVIPNPFYNKFEVNITMNMNCTDDTNILSITTFKENTDGIEFTSRYCNTTKLILNGNVMVVTLITRSGPVEGSGFNMTWGPVAGDQFLTPGLRFVTAYNSYGRTSSMDPYWAAHFMGNSLSTFAFPKGNNTEGYSLQMTFNEVQLEGHICDGAAKGCDMLKICGIEDDGRITSRRTFKGEYFNLTSPEVFRSKFGFFFIMWGGNTFNSTGGGSVVLEYSTLRD